MHVTYLICHHGPSVWDLHLSWFWKQDLWSLRQPACCFYSLTLALLLSLSLSQGIKVKTGITWSVKHSLPSSLCLFLSFPSTFCLFSTVLADLYVYPTASSADDQRNVKEGWETEMDFEVKCLDEEPQSSTKGKLLQRSDLLHNFWQMYILTSWSKCLSWHDIRLNTASSVSMNRWDRRKIWCQNMGSASLTDLSASIMSLIFIKQHCRKKRNPPLLLDGLI